MGVEEVRSQKSEFAVRGRIGTRGSGMSRRGQNTGLAGTAGRAKKSFDDLLRAPAARLKQKRPFETRDWNGFLELFSDSNPRSTADVPAISEHRKPLLKGAGRSNHLSQHLLASKKTVGPARWSASLYYDFICSTGGQQH